MIPSSCILCLCSIGRILCGPSSYCLCRYIQPPAIMMSHTRTLFLLAVQSHTHAVYTFLGLFSHRPHAFSSLRTALQVARAKNAPRMLIFHLRQLDQALYFAPILLAYQTSIGFGSSKPFACVYGYLVPVSLWS